MKPTNHYSAMLYALADEIRKEDGCTTQSAEEVEEAAERLDTLTVTIRGTEIQRDELLADKERLDFLDSNIRFKMGWHVGAAPVGNLLVSSVIQLTGKVTNIREAIDDAIASVKGGAA